MTWWSDYNVILKGDANANCSMDLAAWVTVVNQSGASYPNAQLKLVAGEVNRAPAAPAPMALGMAKRSDGRKPRHPDSRNRNCSSTTCTRSAGAPNCRTTRPSNWSCSRPRSG
jgi:hypothetical protein